MTDRELGHGRHRNQPRCRHRSCASHKPTHRGPRRQRAENDSRRSPRSRECCTARWWQTRPLVGDQDGKRRQYNAPRLPNPVHQDVRWPSPAAARQDRRESVRTHAWSGQCEVRDGAARPGRGFGGFSLTDYLLWSLVSPTGRGRVIARSWSWGLLESPCRSSAVSVSLSPP